MEGKKKANKDEKNFEGHMEGKRKDNKTKTFLKDVWKVREKLMKIKLS